MQKLFDDPDADHSILVDVRGVRRTETLFLETNRNDNYQPIYTLREQDKDGLISAYRIYMDSIDENHAAQRLLGSYSHWRKLCGLKWFMEGRPEVGFEGVNQWREDMRARDATLARRTLLAQTESGNVPAAKSVLAESTKGRVGRPKKEVKEDTERSSNIKAIHKSLLGNNKED